MAGPVGLAAPYAVCAFAVQDGEGPGRKPRRILQREPSPADRRPRILDRLNRLILIA